jgi:hypothetical protein
MRPIAGMLIRFRYNCSQNEITVTTTLEHNLGIKRIVNAVKTSTPPVMRGTPDTLAELLGPAFCISLATKPERRAFCQQQFDAEKAPVTLFDAIVPADRKGFPTIGAHGCYQSHLRVLELGLQECERTGASHITIFEDDVLLPSGFGEVVKTVLPRLAGLPWNFFYWGTINRPPTKAVRNREPIVEIVPEQTVIGKQAYTVRAEIIRPLLEHLRESGRNSSPGYSDGMFHEFRIRHEMPAHTHTLSPARQGSFASNITPRAHGWLRQPIRALKRRLQLWTR